jgi:hypothetical protein
MCEAVSLDLGPQLFDQLVVDGLQKRIVRFPKKLIAIVVK